MKKITLLFIIITTISSAQLRVGIDARRDKSIGGLLGAAVSPLFEDGKLDGMGYTLGYDYMPILSSGKPSFLGLGAEYTMGGKEGIDMVYGYVVSKIFNALIIRGGYSLPLGDGDTGKYKNEWGFAWGLGLRIKSPDFPVGLELLYTIHKLKEKSIIDDLDNEEIEELFDNLFGLRYSVRNITLTYSF